MSSTDKPQISFQATESESEPKPKSEPDRPAVADDADAGYGPQGLEATTPSTASANPSPPVTTPAQLPALVPEEELKAAIRAAMGCDNDPPFSLAKNGDADLFAVYTNTPNPEAHALRSADFHALLAVLTIDAGNFTSKKLEELLTRLEYIALTKAPAIEVWYRVAPIDGGIEIDVHDDAGTRLRITDVGVQTIDSGSTTIFAKKKTSRALPRLGNDHDWRRLLPFLNCNAMEQKILIGWLTYTIAAPKSPSTKYIHLLMQGDQGTGKSTLCRILLHLLDPSSLSLQTFPANTDLPIVLNHCHVAAFDNAREVSPALSDLLCVASTRGVASKRKLYSDSGISSQLIHGAAIINTIHSLELQSDLAERCLTINTQPLDDGRQAEADLLAQFERDAPEIYAGLLELTSQIFARLPEAKISHPERMIEFCRWLAAMEGVLDIPPGSLQSAYSLLLNDAQRETLLDDPLGEVILRFAEQRGEWIGRPSELYTQLYQLLPKYAHQSHSWPRTASALSKRLNSIKASLRSQGIVVELTRGKHRQIRIKKEG